MEVDIFDIVPIKEGGKGEDTFIGININGGTEVEMDCLVLPTLGNVVMVDTNEGLVDVVFEIMSMMMSL
jgi:hypothetical protein